MKINSIQILRGGAAWMVVLHHFMQLFYNFTPTNFLGNFFSFHGGFGVDIFFVISGFIMAYILSTNNSITSKNFFINRIIRIVPNYWFWTLVVLIMGVFIEKLSSSYATFETVLMSLLFISHENPDPILGIYPTLTVGWTLNIEMFFYFILAFILLFKFSLFQKMFITVFIILILPFIYKVFGIEFYKYVFGNIRLFEFAFGIIVFYFWKEHNKVFFSKYLILSASLLLITLNFIPNYLGLKPILISGLIVYLCLILEKCINSESYIVSKLVYLGEISYSTYLVHVISLWLVYSVFNEITSILLLIITLFVYIGITYFLSKISYKLIEIKLSQKIKERVDS